MRKMKGSGSYLKNQVRKNMAKAAFCLFLFILFLLLVCASVLFSWTVYMVDIVGLAVSLVPLVAFYYYLRRYRIYNGGWTGEKQVTTLLSSKLSDDYLLLNDLHLQNGGGDIDHIVLAPSGVYVLETKNWSGNISCQGDQWRRPGKRDSKGSPSLQVKRNAARIRRVIDSSPSLRALGIGVEGVVVFTNRHATLNLNNPTVTVLRLPQLPSHITAQKGAYTYSRQQLENLGKEILKQKT
jgi:hypothetical protein